MTRAREVPDVAGGLTRIPEAGATAQFGDVQLEDRVSFVAAAPEDAPDLDAAAGCEFLDDLVRLRE